MWYKTKSISKLGSFSIINNHLCALGHTHSMNSHCIYFMDLLIALT